MMAVQEMTSKTFHQAATRIGSCLVFFFLVTGLVACTNRASWTKGGQATPFKPPPASGSKPVVVFAVSPTPPLQEVDQDRQAAVPECSDGLTFLDDLTIPDGTTVQPEDMLDKRWLVKNSGGCNWMKDYRLRLVSGPAMGEPEEQALYPARSGSQAELRMVFDAPKEAGLYRSAWQAYNPRGEAFGDPFFIEVVVQSP